MMNDKKMDMSTAANGKSRDMGTSAGSKSRNMDTTEVRHFLESATEALVECERLRRRVNRLSTECERLVRTEGLAHPSETLQELWRLLEEERVREVEAVRHEIQCYHAVEAFIDALPDPMERTVLRRRYLDGQSSWGIICFRLEEDGIYYSQRQIQRFYTAALKTAQSLWETREAVSA